MGIEPTSTAWKAEVLPLNYTRADDADLPAEPRFGSARPRTASLPAPNGGGGRIRTFEGVSRQIYSLLPLAAWVPLRKTSRVL
jgi:hypothetical protein